jgi:manganese/zinc/iron transport system permease protein
MAWLSTFWSNHEIDIWIVAVGILCSLSCALLGNFLVLRRMSMMGDAISHAVLPGIGAAFLLMISLQESQWLADNWPRAFAWVDGLNARNPFVMLIGAVVAGVLTTVFTQWVQSFGKVDRGAAMGVVFTFLFAAGLVLIVQTADHVDLDPSCVLYGNIEFTPLDAFEWRGVFIPRAVPVLGGVLLLNVLVITLFYKELKLSSFDPGLATTLGINARVMHYVLMVLVAITTVASFEAIGSILVIAMLIVPAAAAHMLTDRLWTMMLASIIVAIVGAVGGHVAAIYLPGMIFDGVEGTSTAGMMAVTVGFVFLLCMLFAPRHGVISRMGHRAALSFRIIKEDLLGLLYRMEELDAAQHMAAAPALLRQGLGVSRITSWLAAKSLEAGGKVVRHKGGLELTDAGREQARGLVRVHRLWETFLYNHLPLGTDRLHAKAERLEHITDPNLADQLAHDAGQPEQDPHGRDIPPQTPDPQ